MSTEENQAVKSRSSFAEVAEPVDMLNKGHVEDLSTYRVMSPTLNTAVTYTAGSLNLSKGE